MIIILSGSIGRLPFGGHAWIDMQYIAGLREMGHEVVYLEECGEESWVYNWETEQLTNDLAYPSSYVRDCLQLLNMQSRWIYRAGEQSAGMSVEEFSELCSRADLFIVRAVPLPLWRPEYMWPRRRIFIDADPGFTQISLVQGHPELTATVERCGQLFTIGQCMGAPGCLIPTAGREWTKTLPPVSLVHWPLADARPAAHFTSIMQWRGFRDVTYKGVAYGQKDREFPRYIDLPGQTSQRFEIALTGNPPMDMGAHGWRIVPGWLPSRTPESYRAYIQGSRAEFGVAKHGYVKMRGGWFSDRSVCYLASGRPVLVEDTGLENWLPVGRGVVTFQDVSTALSGIENINANYEQHCTAARLLAEEYFSADRVLKPLLEG